MAVGSLKRILLVDDEADVRLVAKMALELTGGLEVLDVRSGADALRVAATGAPDLILLDVMMPEMDGPATLRELRARRETAEIPVVFLTAKTMPGDIGALRALGALYVIAKPFDPMTLADELESVWRAYCR